MNEATISQLLKWDVDHLVFLGEYNAYHWLKPSFDKDRKRIGITSCCELNYECERHKKIRMKTEIQNVSQN